MNQVEKSAKKSVVIVTPYIFLVAVIGIGAFSLVYSYWRETDAIEKQLYDRITARAEDIVRQEYHLRQKKLKPAKRVVKGVYLTAYTAGSKERINQIIDLIDRTELNAVVIDVKDYSGHVLYDSQVPMVNNLKLNDNQIGDVPALLRLLHEHDIYAIARQTVFQDPALAEKKSDWAIRHTSGSVWRDRKGLAWVDPTKKEVWDYNLSIAKEVIRLGFDEINFDYVRFPSDGDLRTVVYTNGEKKRYEIMTDFFSYLDEALKDEPAWISVDLFGLVMERDTDDLGIGQRVKDVVPYVDYVSPMMYPSHYPAGHLGFANPAANPSPVIEHGMKTGSAKFDHTRAQVRPWLQAFDLGAVYDAEKIRAQIEMVEKYAQSGWLLWNAANVYSAAGLRPEQG